MTKGQLLNIRLGDSKQYWLEQLKLFAGTFNDDIKCVQFGKQDIRAGISIALVDSRGCVPKVLQFSSKDMMLGYIQCYNDTVGKCYNEFKQFNKDI